MNLGENGSQWRFDNIFNRRLVVGNKRELFSLGKERPFSTFSKTSNFSCDTLINSGPKRSFTIALIS